MLSRYAHVLSGITWIGLLYFFNFVQTPAFAEMSAEGRTEAQRKITWRALWWFRWAALVTFLFGLSIIAVQDDMDNYFSASGAPPSSRACCSGSPCSSTCGGSSGGRRR